MNCRVCGLPPAADESATGLEIAATYFATLPVTLHCAGAGRIPDDAEARAPGAVLGDDVARLIGAVVLVEAEADVGRQAIADAPGVVDEPRVRAEVRALALLEDRVPLNRRGAVAEEDREDVVLAGAAAA